MGMAGYESFLHFAKNYQFVRFGNEKNRFLPLQPSGNLKKRLDFKV
jgi:hypothetical protein